MEKMIKSNNNKIDLKKKSHLVVIVFIIIGFFNILILPVNATDEVFSGNISSDQNVFHTITVSSASDIIDITISWDNTLDDLDIYLYDNYQKLKAQSTSSTGTYETITYDPSSTGTYSLKIEAKNIESQTTITYTGTSNYPISTQIINTYTGTITNTQNTFHTITVNTINMPVDITLTWENTQDDLNIYLYDNYQNLKAQSTSTTGTYETITYDPSSTGTYSLKIEAKNIESQTTITYTGTSNYPITSDQMTGSITVIQPNGGEIWNPGTRYTITWDSYNIGDEVNIKLYKNDVLDSIIKENTSDDGSYTWIIPDIIEENSNYKIMIESSIDSSTYDFSDNYFSISSTSTIPTITVTQPNGGETWNPGVYYSITWESDEFEDNVDIKLYRQNDFDSIIVADTSDDGSYTWIIPDNQEEGSMYKIMLESSIDDTIYDYSDNYFTISKDSSIQTITVIQPNGGETLNPEMVYKITWESENIGDYVDIYLVQNSFDEDNIFTEDLIVDNIYNNGEYDWTIPSDYSQNARYYIKIVSSSNSSIFDISDSYFLIKTNWWTRWGFIIIFIVIIILLIILGIFFYFRKKRLKIENKKSIERSRFDTLKEKINIWKHEGYDVDELEKKIELTKDDKDIKKEKKKQK
jgi:hypothetical protein